MRVLIIDSEGGVGLDFAIRCQNYGHEVKLYIKNPPDSVNTTGVGLVPRVSDYHPWLKWADLIFPTGNAAFLKERDALIAEGFPIFGAGTLGCKLEIDRKFAMDLLERHGTPMIPHVEVENLDAAQQYIKKNGGMYVVKTLGSEEDKSLTHVPSHEDYAEEELIHIFDKWKKQGKMKGKILLQEFFPGVEVGISCFFGKGGFSKWKNLNFEHKKLMSNNFGPATGEMGTVVQYVEDSILFDKMLKPIEEYLHAVNYVGDIAANCIVNDKGEIGFLEYTARAGWPHWLLVQQTHKSDPAQWMLDCIDGKDTLKVSTDVCIGLVIAQPNFPYTKNTNKDAEGIPLLGINDKNIDNLHFCQVRKGKKTEYETSGEYVMIAADTGKTVSEAAKNVYKHAKYIGLPNKVVRDDVGEKLKENLPKLHKLGIAKSMNYE